MKNRILILALILCVMLALFAFASCGKKTAEATTGKMSDPTGQATTAEPTTPEATTAEPPAHVHTPATTYTVDKEATCSEAGSKSYHCTECGMIVPETVVEIPADASAHDVPSWTITKKPTLLDQAGSRHGECSVCHNDVVEILTFEPSVYNPADLSNYDGDKSMLLLSKTLPEVLAGDHFYPTDDAEYGKALYYEMAILFNETMANSATDNFNFQLNVRGKGGRTIYCFTTKDNGSGWCKWAGGFDYSTATEKTFGPEGGNGAAKENYPNLGAYGWHNIGVKLYETASLVEGTVVYGGEATLYIDGVKVWVITLNMTPLQTNDNMLFIAKEQGGVLTYSDPSENVRFQLRGEGINNSAAPMFFIYSDETWAVVDPNFEPSILPVASPEAKVYTTETGIDMPASIYFTKPCDEHVWDGEFTVTRKATLLEDGDKVEHCSVCGFAHKVPAAFELEVYDSKNPAGPYVENDTYTFRKTVAAIRGDKSFAPTEDDADGNDLWFEYSFLWNDSLQYRDRPENQAEIRMFGFRDTADLSANNYRGFYYLYLLNDDNKGPADGAFHTSNDCPWKGHIDFSTYYPGSTPGQNCAIDLTSEGNTLNGKPIGRYIAGWGAGRDDAPYLWDSEYQTLGGWHRLGFHYHQEAEIVDGEVRYSGYTELYIDGVKCWKVLTNMEGLKKGDGTWKDTDWSLKGKNLLLWTAEIDPEDNTKLVYTNNDAVAVEMRIDTITSSSQSVYICVDDINWTCGDGFATEVVRVETPVAKTITLAEGVEVSGAMYFAKPND